MEKLSDQIAKFSPEKRALLEKLLQKKQAERQDALAPHIAASPRDGGHYELSSAEQRLWFLDQFSDTDSAFNLHAALELTGALDAACLARSFEQLVQRHEILRTRYVKIDGEPRRVVDESSSFRLETVDLRDVRDPAEREADVQRRTRAHAHRNFRLDRGPLLAATLLALEDDRHVLLIAMHHIVSDAWSLTLMLNEIRQGYLAAKQGRAPAAALAVQYLDYALWQRRELASPRLQRQVDYWRAQLAGAPDLLEFPADRPRPATQTYAGHEVSFRVPRELMERLKLLGRERNASLFMVTLSVYVALLARFSGQTDIVVGTDVANRNFAETEPLIGFFVNQLALRCRLDPAARFDELLHGVRRVCLDAYSNQDVPFNHLVDQLGVSRDASRTPLFQVKFMLQNTPDADIAGAALNMRAIERVEDTSQFDLLLALKENADGAYGSLRYRTDLFDVTTAERLVEHYLALLEKFAAQPERRLNTIGWLGGKERALLASINDAQAAYPFLCLPDAVERSALAEPSKVALTCAGRELGYAELLVRTERLAAHLIRLGVTREQPVAICLPRGIDMVIALLAVLRSGGCYVPIDPEYGAERVAYVLADSGARLVLCADAAGALPAGVERVVLDHAWHERLTRDVPAHWPRLQREQLAYVIYTSGSTGRPKGVAVRHHALGNFLQSLRDLTGLAAEDRLLAVTTVAFDIAALELYLPLVCGASIAIATREEAQDPRLLLACLRAQRISVLQATPTTWRGLLAAADGAPLPIKALCGGEAVPKDLATQLIGSGASLMNVYGPTETTIWSSSADIDVAQLRDLASAPLGRPIANTVLHVLDAHGRPQPLGVPGELYIGGDGLARGYWKKPALTASAFVPDPFAREPGARLYRTGDLVKWLPDGRLAYLGRADHQVKVRGYRIELGEIESVLGAHEDVALAVVVTRPDNAGSALLVAFVQAEDREPEVDDLLRHAAAFLPRYMLPNEVRFVREMPLTPNGKVDRKALARLALDQAAAAPATGTPPTSALELQLADAWRHVLGLPHAHLEQDFFRSGGHSLLAVQLLDRVERATGVALPLQRFFQNPTLGGIVESVESESGERSEYPQVVADPHARHEPFPLTGIQQAYWLGRSGSFELGNIATQNYLEIEIVDLDTERFARAWNRLVRRHEMLRAVFLPDGTQRFLAETPEYTPACHDLRALAPDAREAFLLDLRARMKGRVLPAETGPLFELAFSRRDERRYRVHFCIDMLVSDVISNHILFAELDQLYRDPGAELPALALSFRDYVLAEESLRHSARYERAKEYWTRRIADFAGRPELPLARDPSSLTEQVFSRRRFELAAPLWDAMKQRAQDLRVSPTVLVLSVFGEVLGTWSKSPRFALNLTLFNRLPLHPQVDAIVGDFTSSLLLEMEHAPQRGFAERAVALQSRLWQDLDHKLFGGVDVIRELARARGGAQGAAMPVVFTSILGVSTPATLRAARPDAAPAQAEEGYSSSQTSQVWLDHQVAEQNGALVLVWDALDAIFPDGMLDAMFDAYAARLRTLARDAQSWQRPVCLMPESQRLRRAGINDVPAPIGDECLHELFERTARGTPDAVAIRNAGVAITYAQLARWSDALAQRLVDAGAARGDLVAIVMHKGWEQVVAALAVMKSGAAYMPVDADLPEQRRRQLIADGQARIALTQGDAIAAEGLDVIALDAAMLDALPRAPVAARARAEDLAYVIFTSGSTGKPKGVVIDHRGAVNTVLDINRRFGVGAGDSVLALSSLSFDLSVYDLFGVLAAGGTIVIPTPAEMESAAHWWRLVRDCGVTVWNTVPALMQLLVDHCEKLHAPSLAPLRVVMMSGDWIPVTLPDRIRKLAPAADIISLGGATEASIWSIFHRIDGPTTGTRSVPYGKPLSNQSFHVLDERLQPRPDWVTGQLYIGGIGLARGYWNDPEKTAASFVRGPGGETLYRTGDLGRYMADGAIEFLGREDSQVKVQGYRIELGDIEAALQSHPAIGAAAVSAIGENQESKTLVAYVVARAATAADADSDGDTTIVDHHQRNLFKLEQRGVRRLDAGLARTALDAGTSRIASLLRGLGQVRFDDSPLPKYRYPSASSLYPVQVYVHVDASCAAAWGVAAGFHYYSPREHALVRLASDDPLEPGRRGDAPRVYWIADLDAIRPLYPTAQARRFCALEAGYCSSILAANAGAQGFALEHDWRARELSDSPQLPRHSLLLGRADARATASRSEADEYDALQRQSHRRYAARACTLQQILATLAVLDATPGREYWLHAKPGRCDGLDVAQWYRYVPATRDLVPHSADIDVTALYNDANAAIFASAAFALFVIAPPDETGDETALLAAVGADGQRLMAASWRSQVGLCPIGHVREARLVHALGRETGSRVVHGFVGGPIGIEQTRRWDPEPAAAAAELTGETLAAYLAERLPSYMVPRVYVGLAALPLSSNGKVDRKALPRPDLQAAAGPDAYVAPAGPTEELLAALWSRLLKIDRVGTHDSFFTLGGNSLVAMQLASRLRIEHGIELGLRQIFEQPTIAALAALISRSAASDGADGAAIGALRAAWQREPGVDFAVAREDHALFPLTLAQRHLFAHQQLDDAATAYNIPAALRIDGELDVAALRFALQSIVDRHEALRTRFVYQQGEVWQRVDDRREVELTLVDLGARERGAAEDEARLIVQRDATRPFDLFEGPLLRASVLRLGERRHVLMLNVHHIVADYLSMDILVGELNALYAGGAAALGALPALSLHHADFALWERGFLESARATRELAYWRQRLADVPALVFPERHVEAADDGWQTFRVDGDLLQRLRARAKDVEATVFMLGFAATHQLLSAHCAQGDFALGTPISTRRVPGLEPCVGLLLNTLAIRLAIDDDASGLDLLRETRARCMQAFEHKDYPYEGLLEQRRRPGATGDDAPYRVRYVYRRIEGATAPGAGDRAARGIDVQRRQAKFDLLVTINEADDHVFGELEYRGAALAPATVESFAAQIPIVLAWLADTPERPIAELHALLRAGHAEREAMRKQRRNAKLGDKLRKLRG